MADRKRFDEIYPTNDAFNRFNPLDKKLDKNGESNRPKYGYKTEAGKKKRILEKLPGFSLLDYAFRDAGYTATRFAPEPGGRNRGFYSWNPLGVAHKPSGIPHWKATPERASQVVHKAAVFYGADDVGFSKIDPRWLYSHTFSGKKIVFEDVKTAYETDSKAVIPKSHQWVIVILTAMDGSAYKYAPTAMVAAGGLAYSRMHVLAGTVAEFIRGLGYHAVPSGNDLGFNVPIAIQAGLGHAGRMSRLISWKYGPAVKMSKVFTDLPLAESPLAPEGIIRFCEVCNKCAKHCPSRAIPKGPRTSDGHPGHTTGVLKWHNNEEECNRYWDKVGTSCSICLRVCAFNKPHTALHRTVKWAIRFVPPLNPLWVWADDLLGYGKMEDPNAYWDK